MPSSTKPYSKWRDVKLQVMLILKNRLLQIGIKSLNWKISCLAAFGATDVGFLGSYRAELIEKRTLN